MYTHSHAGGDCRRIFGACGRIDSTTHRPLRRLGRVALKRLRSPCPWG